MNIDQKLELCKIIIGLTLAVIGGLWTYYQYTEDERRTSTKAIIEISEAIVGMQMFCKDTDNELISLAEEELGTRKRRCFEYYMAARKKILSGSSVISRPWLTSEKDWEKAWDEMKKAIEDPATEKYSEHRIGKKWSRILDLKGVKVIDPTPYYAK